MKVDAHHHLFDERRDYPWMDGPWADPLRATFAPEHLYAAMSGHGVTYTVAIQAVSDVSETRTLLDHAFAEPTIAGVVGWVDLTAPDVASTLAALQEAPGGQFLVGIRHQVHDERDPHWLTRPDVLRGLTAIADAGLAYDLLVRPRELPAAASVADALPHLSFVIDHLAKPEIADGTIQPWADRLASLARHPNVMCKVSGLVTEASWESWNPTELRPYVNHALNVFGEDRLIFGSDWPVCTLAASYDQVVAAAETCVSGLSVAGRAKVFGSNATRAYNLGL